MDMKIIADQVKSGRYASASEVVRAALRELEVVEESRARLLREIEKGERSGFVEGFDSDEFLRKLHRSRD